VNPPAVEASFSLRRVQQLLGLSRGVLSGLIDAGFVTPSRGARQQLRFSLQDLMLLRTAHALQAGQIPPRKIVGALTRLRASLPAELPLTGLRLSAVGADVAVRDRSGHWAAESGQLLMDFDVAPVGGSVAFLAPAAATDDPQRWFEQAESIEAADAPGAEAAYRQALALDPSHEAAYLNLGALLCDAQRCEEAVDLYSQAIQHCPDSPLIHFNRAIALEDQGGLAAAVASYERCLELDPSLADAHYNTGCLLEKLGDGRGALRHFSAYRRLERGAPG
jgi:tetratricopeptide (TPR) repeat protein